MTATSFCLDLTSDYQKRKHAQRTSFFTAKIQVTLHFLSRNPLLKTVAVSDTIESTKALLNSCKQGDTYEYWIDHKKAPP